jgi:hypothetical protein
MPSSEPAHDDKCIRIPPLGRILTQKLSYDKARYTNGMESFAMAMGAFTNLVARYNGLVARCEALFAHKLFVIKTNRDDHSLRYLMLIFEHHRGIVMLATDCCSPAFSLMRPITEAFNRLHVTMYGTDNQFHALREDSYRTEYKTEGELVDEISGFEPSSGLFSER